MRSSATPTAEVSCSCGSMRVKTARCTSEAPPKAAAAVFRPRRITARRNPTITASCAMWTAGMSLSTSFPVGAGSTLTTMASAPRTYILPSVATAPLQSCGTKNRPSSP